MDHKERQAQIEALIPDVMPRLIAGMSFNGSLRLDTDVLVTTAKEPEPGTVYAEPRNDYWTMVWLSRIVAGIIVTRDEERAAAAQVARHTDTE